MPPDEPNHYDLEAVPEPPEDPKVPVSPESPESQEFPEVPLSPDSELEDFNLEPEDSDKVHADLDVCPNCGNAMPERDQLVCLKCGFDLKTLKIIDIETSVEEIEAEDQREKCLSRAGVGDQWLPGGIAAVAAVALMFGYAAGAGGLYSPVAGSGDADATVINAGMRLSELVRFLVSTLLWTGCAVAGLFFTAHILKQRVGDLRLALIRLMALVLAAKLMQFIDFTRHEIMEHGLEITLEFAVFIALGMGLFQLALRDAATMAAVTAISFLLLLGASHLVVWIQ